MIFLLEMHNSELTGGPKNKKKQQTELLNNETLKLIHFCRL